MAQVLTVPQPARFSRSYVAIWGLAELGKSLVGRHVRRAAADLLPGLPRPRRTLDRACVGHLRDLERDQRPALRLHHRQHPVEARPAHPLHALHRALPRPDLHPGVGCARRVPGSRGYSGGCWAPCCCSTPATPSSGLVLFGAAARGDRARQRAHRLQVSASLLGLLGMLLGFIIPDLFRPKAGTAGSVSFLPLQVSMVVVGDRLRGAAPALHHPRSRSGPSSPRSTSRCRFARRSATRSPAGHSSSLVAANFMSILMNSLLLGVDVLPGRLRPAHQRDGALAAVFVPLMIGVPVTHLVAAAAGHCGHATGVPAPGRRSG